jgi:phage replication-related protein YjqB (UPF0714/DUF867 family)
MSREPDWFNCFADLAACQQEGVDYAIRATPRKSPIAVVAPHGGWIEPGTSALAEAIAGEEFALYLFEGLRNRPHHELHITSARFDEPRCLSIMAGSEIVIAVHGRGKGDGDTIWIGGAEKALGRRIRETVEAKRYAGRTENLRLPGADANNICNRGKRGAGIQLELTRKLRDELSDDRERREDLATAIRGAAVAFIGKDGA